MRNFYSGIEEALRLEKAKELTKNWDRRRESHISMFGNKIRVIVKVEYEPPGMETSVFDMTNYDSSDDISYLSSMSEMNTTDKQRVKRMVVHFSKMGFTQIDFINGTVKTGNRGQRITRAWNKIKSDMGNEKRRKNYTADQIDYYENFGTQIDGDVDYFNVLKSQGKIGGRPKGYIAVISRHPYDIAGMSTDRGWSSCMNLGSEECAKSHPERGYQEPGIYSNKVEDEIDVGTLISYLTTEDDKNINNPTGRLLIKPYFLEEPDSEDSSSVYYKTAKRFYPPNSVNVELRRAFRKAVNKWLREHQQKANGVYVVNDTSYTGDGEKHRIRVENGDYFWIR